MNKQKANLVKLPNGECIDPCVVKAIRKGDPQEAGTYASAEVPRVMIEYVLTSSEFQHHKCITLACDTIKARDELALTIHALLT